MEDAGILSYRIVFFEFDEEDAFNQPGGLAAARTRNHWQPHDLARLHGWWEERDIDPGAEGPAGRAPEEHPVGAGVALGCAAATPQGSEHEAAWWMFCFWLCRAPYNIDRPPVTGTTAPEM
jgi:hypothetical protein